MCNGIGKNERRIFRIFYFYGVFFNGVLLEVFVVWIFFLNFRFVFFLLIISFGGGIGGINICIMLFFFGYFV